MAVSLTATEISLVNGELNKRNLYHAHNGNLLWVSLRALLKFKKGGIIKGKKKKKELRQMSVNLKQVYNAIHDLGREIVMLESPDDGIGIAFKTDGGIIRCEFDGARKLTGIFVDKNIDNYKFIKG